MICKTLYEDKLALQAKHQDLISRIPLPSPSRPPSTSPSPAHTPTHSFSGLPHPVSEVSFPRRIRKISVSPQDISLLAEQNAELLVKLEKIETESVDTDLRSRRELKKLEKEISLLRDELEQTQGELEKTQAREKAQSGFDPEKAAEDMAKRRLERESRLKALRASSNINDQPDDPIRDFAPGGPLSSIPSTVWRPVRTECLQDVSSPIQEQPVLEAEPFPDPWKTPPRKSRPASGDGYTLSEPQLAVISQLLAKIQELEDTNAKIIEQQKETSTKLQAVQRETDNISKVYECLSDLNGVKLELVEDASFTSDEPDGGNTIRFRSLRRTLESDDLLKMMGEISDSDISPLNLVPNSVRKNRKSVMELFESSSPSPTPGLKDQSSNLLFPFPTNDSWSSDSPSYSNLSLARSSSESPVPFPQSQNLRSELGSEYGEDWSLNVPNHHLRTSSLYNLSQLQLSTSPTPSRRTSLLTPDAEVPHGLRTPVSNVLQLTLEPPTPPIHFDDGDSSTLGSGSVRSNQTAKQRRLSQTIRSRTHRWVDGRFTDSVLGASPEESRSSDTITDLATVSNKGVRRVIRDLEPDTETTDTDKQLSVAKAERHAVSKFILLLWLWLQFVVIVIVFLFAMARRGPKAILSDAERRSAVARRH